MEYVGKLYKAALHKDGKLHWDDGDVWTRAEQEIQVRTRPPWLQKSCRRKHAAQNTDAAQQKLTGPELEDYFPEITSKPGTPVCSPRRETSCNLHQNIDVRKSEEPQRKTTTCSRSYA